MDFEYMFDLKMTEKNSSFGGKSTFKISQLFNKTKWNVPAVVGLGSVDQSYIHSTPVIDSKNRQYKLCYNGLTMRGYRTFFGAGGVQGIFLVIL